jgi:4-amino-4-deoxy-L-arabinose transferase-like glycosyltransferase
LSDNNQTAMPPADASARYSRLFYIFTTILFLFRLFLAQYLDLTPDETYYWELARQPDWSYYDHPPMVAWLIALIRLLPGETQLHIRILTIAGTAFAGWVLFAIGRDCLNNARAGFWAAVMLNSTPACQALGFITTPDTPLAIFWSLGIYAFLKALNDKRERWWLVTGLALGCGALSKYNMILFVPGVAITILTFKRYRHLVTTRRYWLMVLLAALGTVPIIYWNIQHDWISFKFQLDTRLAGNTRSLLQNLGEFIGGQLGTIGLTLWPVLWFIAISKAWTSYQRDDEKRFFLAWLTLPALLFFTHTAMKSKIEANWPQIAYLSSMLLAAEWLCEPGKGRRRIYWVLGPSAALALIAVVQALTLALPLPPNADISLRLHGWRQMGAIIKEADRETGNKLLFAGQGATLTTLTGYYGELPSSRIAEIVSTGNFKVWLQDRLLSPGSDMIYVDDNNHSEAMNWAKKFNSHTARSYDIYHAGKKIRTINLTHMQNLKEPMPFHR